MTQQEVLPPVKRKAGRPKGTGIKIDYERLRNLAARGLNKVQIALCLGISRATLFNHLDNDEAFEEAYAKGKAEGIAAVAARLLKAIEGGDTQAMMFYLRTQAGWKERSVIEVTHSPEVIDSECTMEEAEAAYARTMRMITAKT